MFSAAAGLGFVAIMTGLQLAPRRIAVLGGMHTSDGVLSSTVAITADCLDSLHNHKFEIVAVPALALMQARREGVLGDEARWVGMRIEAVHTMVELVVLAFGP